MRLDKIYTKIGDKGKTMLASGEKISKSHIRIEAYGTVDELNSVVALTVDSIKLLENSVLDNTLEHLLKIQNELFDVGGELATPSSLLDINKQQVVTNDSISRLENEIDAMNKTLPPLENFILPGGNLANSYTHLARCICRRAERNVVRLNLEEEIRSEVYIYLNRLSDWFFVASRFISKHCELKERLWDQNKK